MVRTLDRGTKRTSNRSSQAFSINFHHFHYSPIIFPFLVGDVPGQASPCPVKRVVPCFTRNGSVGSSAGLLVYRTERCSWAEAAGLRRGDQLVKVSGVDAKLLTLGSFLG